MPKYDYLIVGAGLFGAVFASEAKKVGKSCLVIDRRSHIAGNVYTEEIGGIHVQSSRGSFQARPSHTAITGMPFGTWRFLTLLGAPLSCNPQPYPAQILQYIICQ